MPTATPICYQLDCSQVHAHLFEVHLTIAEPQARQVVSLPVWIPGSYMVREFAKHLQQLSAQQAGESVALTQLDKSTWEIASQSGAPLTLRYLVYAFDASVRTAFLDSQRGFFNGTSVCLRVHGQEDALHEIQLLAPSNLPHWYVATSLSADQTDHQGWGRYLAHNYDELVDSPFTLGAFWSGTFTAGEIPHRVVVTGAPPTFNGDRLLKDMQQICSTAIRFWHPQGQPAPHAHYLFALHASDSGYGGLEHRHSTALLCARKSLPRYQNTQAADDYNDLLGLISHEYFHTWNVKRLRPQEFTRYDYTQENYTQMLWFFEGFTSYYDNLLLRRAGLLDDTVYLKRLVQTINDVMYAPGRQVQSVAQASFDAWTKFYRPDENTPNATVNYYSLGSLIALCCDLKLRQPVYNSSLDTLMRALWARCAGGPMTQDDFAEVLTELSSAELTQEVLQWVHGRVPLPLHELFPAHGVSIAEEPIALAAALGLRVSPGPLVRVITVLRSSAAEQAGLAAGDECLAVNDWRLSQLEDLPLYVEGDTAELLVARDKRLLRLRLRWPEPQTVWRLRVTDAAQVQAWLMPGN